MGSSTGFGSSALAAGRATMAAPDAMTEALYLRNLRLFMFSKPSFIWPPFWISF
jgi:hypothetical protein